jgi:soluble lytic murein transglycosylase
MHAAHAGAAAAAERRAEPQGEERAAGSIRAAARVEDYRTVAAQIDALGETTRQRPDLLYLRARAALALNEASRAVELLEGLEQRLPELGDEISHYRALAELDGGDPLRAAQHFEQKGDLASWLQAAHAFERAGRLADASRMLTKVFAKFPKAKPSERKLEPEARLLRAKVSQAQGISALADLLWLATEAPLHPASRDADAAIAKLSPAHRLKREQRLARARAFSQAGEVELTETELELLGKASGRAVPRAELLSIRAYAYYQSRRDYRLAAELFAESAKLAGGQGVRELYLAARARSRADEDALAIRMYGDVVKRYPRSGYAESARYYSARLHYIGGDFGAAAKAYEEVLARHGKKGRYAPQAQRELAISHLASGKARAAEKALGELADASKNPLEAAEYLELRAVALLGLGRKAEAAALFERVIRERPLSFSALASTARLAELGHVAPPHIAPAAHAPELSPVVPVLPPKVKLLADMGLDADAELTLIDHEPSVRALYPERGAEALCRAYGELSGAHRRYVTGQRAARTSVLNVAPSTSGRWLWECIYPRPYAAFVQELEEEYRLPRHLVHAVMRQESNFRRDARSPADAMGLMQLIRPTALRVAAELEHELVLAELTRPAVNIRFGAYYLAKLLRMFGENQALAAAAYNAGPKAVSNWLAGGESLPLDVFVARIPFEETRGYVHRVLGNLARYGYLEGGDASVPRLDLHLPKGQRAQADAY